MICNPSRWTLELAKSSVNGHVFESMASSAIAAAALIGETTKNGVLEVKGAGGAPGVTYNGINEDPSSVAGSSGKFAKALATGIAYRSYQLSFSKLLPGAAYFLYIPVFGWNRVGRSTELSPSDGGEVLVWSMTGSPDSQVLLRYGFVATATGSFSMDIIPVGPVVDGVVVHGAVLVRAQDK